jgi:N-acetylglutamate synthase-like GNAT family acetyltransferase
MSVEISQVLSNEDIEDVASLAREIWSQHFTSIIGESQVEYMLTNFQSSAAIKTQINHGSEYYLVKKEREYVGYLGLNPDFDQNKMMLSKIYVEYSFREKGVGQSILDFVEKECVLRGFSSVWLTVNKFNDDTVAWYNRRGFLVIDKVKKDIGNGFFMGDYLMEKII